MSDSAEHKEAPGQTATDEGVTNRVHTLKLADREVMLVGLADHSPANLAHVDHLLKEWDPRSVCLELCETRRRMISDPDFWEEATVLDTIKRGRGVMLLASLAASVYLGRHGEFEVVRPGSEMLGRIETAEREGKAWLMADRDMLLTLRRAWNPLRAGQKARLLFSLLRALVPWPGRKPPEGTRPTKPSHHLQSLIGERLPHVGKVLFEENNLFFWSSIVEAEGERVLAVVNLERLDGILAAVDRDIDREALQMPPEKKGGAWKSWLFLPILALLTWFAASRSGDIPLEKVMWAWVLPNALLTGLFAALGGARILSIVAGMLVSPFTPLSPALRSGLVVGLVETWLRKPIVRDAEAMPRDVRAIQSVYRNPLTRVVLVAWLAHAGSSLGNYVGAFFVFVVVT